MPTGKRFSVCLPSDGSYGVPEGLVFGFPVTSDGNKVSIVQGIEHGAFGQEKLRITREELEGEREAVKDMLVSS